MSPPSRPITCPYCNSPALHDPSQGSFFCGSCRIPLGTAPPSPTQHQPDPSESPKKKGLSVVHWLGIVFLLPIGVWYIWSQAKDSVDNAGQSPKPSNTKPLLSTNKGKCFSQNKKEGCKALLDRYTIAKNYSGMARVMKHWCNELKSPGMCYLVAVSIVKGRWKDKKRQLDLAGDYYKKACHLFLLKKHMTSNDKRAMELSCSAASIW